MPLLLLLWLVGCAARQPSPSSLSTGSLERRSATMVGALGLPLGTVTEIEATVVVIPSPFIVGAGLGRWYGLRVDTIHGKALRTPPTLKFEVEGTMRVKLAPNDAGLQRLWRRLSSPGEFSAHLSPGEVGSAEPLSEAEIERLRSTYVGSRRRLLVYETGRFFGNPHGIPEKYGFVFGPAAEFAFESFLKVFDELEEPNQAPEPMPGSVTPGADARLAPAPVVAYASDATDAMLPRRGISQP